MAVAYCGGDTTSSAPAGHLPLKGKALGGHNERGTIMNTYLLKQYVRQSCGVRIFAERMGWHRKKVQSLLRGRFEPDRAEIVKIAKALRMGRSDFLETIFPELTD